MSDLDAQLAFLRAQRDAAPNASARAMFEQLLTTLEQQVAPVEAASSQSHIQYIGGYTTIAMALAGDVHGDIYIVGERAQSVNALLAGYLRWLASQCGQLPLRGVREQKAATDVLNIGLDQVYTQLATEVLVIREMFAGAALEQLDVQAFVSEHVGELLLPGRQRRIMAATPASREHRAEHMIGMSQGRDGFDLRTLSADELARTIQGATDITFYGPQLVTEAIAAAPRLVLLGEPGSGKSTALRYLALTLARAGLDNSLDLAVLLEGWQRLGEHGRLIPLFMPLLPLAKRLAAQPGRNGTAADLWAAFDAHLIDHGATADVVSAMRAELAQGRVLLLLDGLDEVAGGESRRQVVDAVQSFADQQPQCRIVVACRVRAYNGSQNTAWQLPGWPTATLADWTPGQVRAFVDAWYAAAAAASRMPDTKRDERVAALQRAVAEREDLRRLSIRPLLLTIMALVHLNDGELPEERVTLYSRCLDILLGQWEIAGKDATDYGTLMHYIGLQDATVKSLRPLLARAAYLAHDAAAAGEVGRLRRADLRELLADGLEQLKHPNAWKGAERFLEYADVRAGLLQATEAGDAYAFPHQTFQEYLAGLELISGVDFVDRIMARRGDDRWRVPIMLGVGHTVSEGVLAAPYQLLSRLLHARGRDEAQRQRDLIFAAEIAEDVGWNRLERGGAEFSALRAELAKALAGVVEGTALPAAERVRAGVLLGRLGDPRPGVCDLPPMMVRIEGGRFVIGNTKQELKNLESWYSNTENIHPVTVAPFELARYPVTNAQFKHFIDDDGYAVARAWWDTAGKAWLRQERRREPSYWRDERLGIARPNLPVVGVTWYEAMAFCRWLTGHRQYNPPGYGYTLPSEAEWEYAARGMERRPYTWGAEEPDGERANFGNQYGGTTAVGCFASGMTPEGVLDLTGNVMEWIRSIYDDYPYDLDDDRENTDDPSGKRITLRGGGWNSLPLYLCASNRRHDLPRGHSNVAGFRLARHLPPGSPKR